MNRIRMRASAVTSSLAAFGLAAAVALTGCSAGQLTQTSTQEAAVNGTSAAVGNLALRNVHLRVVQTTDYVQPGKPVELLMVVSNQSPDVNDELVGITSDIGTVTVRGDAAIPANGVLIVGTPDGQQTAPLDTVEAADAAKATVTLTKPITNGITYNFTFDFAEAGQTTVAVPIDAGAAPRREQSSESG